jgi:phospholipid/cholesterol/gamma-HCH transport system substrate-binding protein
VVTYRGTEIGTVKSIDVDHDGVRAVLTLDSATKVPADVSAAVHSRSAVGEQFLELTPKPHTPADGPKLGDGDVIPVGDTQIPADIGHLLDATNRALKAIPPDNLRTVVDEADKAVGWLGPELSRIVDGSTSLAIESGKSVDQITQLIDEAPPVLNSQVQSADSIATWAQRMASITGQFKAQDAAFADLLTAGAPALNEGKALFDRVAPALPLLLANLVSLGDIAVTYRNDLEQLLVLFPQGTAVMSAIALADSGVKQAYKGIYLDFNLNLNLPPPCNTGFLPVQQQRSPSDQDYPERPAGELYCRIPQDSDMNVRGVRNIPCETKPGKRAPTVELCESDEQYVPLNNGLNWKGDPNATLSGQGVPQYAAGQDPRLPPTQGTGAALPSSGVQPPAAAPVAAVAYDPATGDYIGPDGKRSTQADLAHPGNKTWQSMLVPPG